MKRLLIAVFVLGSMRAFAGNESGGGMGVVCRNADGTVKSVELLDLWEAQQIYGRKIEIKNTTVAAQVEDGLQNLKHAISTQGYAEGNDCFEPGEKSCIRGVEAFYRQLKWNADRFLYDGNPSLPQFRRLRGVKLTRTNDSFEVATPIDCEIEQLVRYTDTAQGGDILLNQDLLDKMNNTNLSALYLHEVFYAMLRGYERSSIRVRRVIGQITSGFRFTQWDAFLPKEYYDCAGPKGNRLYVYLTNYHGDRIAATHLESVNGRVMIGTESPLGGVVTNSLEDAFNYKQYRFIDKMFSYDYSVTLTLGRENGLPIATLQTTAAPDQDGPSEEARLECKKVYQ